MTGFLLAAVVIPFLGAALVLFAPDRWARYVCVLTALLSFAAVVVLLALFTTAGRRGFGLPIWTVAGVTVWGLTVDNLSVLIAFAVGLVGALICLYSVGYMTPDNTEHPDVGRPRFFFYMQVFVGAMAGLVFSSTIIGTLFFYEVSSDLGAQLCEAANDGMAKLCAVHPDRLRWLANLPMQDPPRAVAVYRAALAQGCVGAAIGTSIAGQRLDEPVFEEFWAAAEQAGRPVLVHPAFNEPNASLEPYYFQNVIGNPLETTVMVERMICAGVFSVHPELRLPRLLPTPRCVSA